MFDDVRKAMLGDKEAAKRLTERGELLPCPICNGIPARHKIKEDFLGVGWEMAGFNVYCQECRTGTEYLKSQKEADKRWNTRRQLLTKEQIEALERMED